MRRRPLLIAAVAAPAAAVLPKPAISCEECQPGWRMTQHVRRQWRGYDVIARTFRDFCTVCGKAMHDGGDDAPLSKSLTYYPNAKAPVATYAALPHGGDVFVTFADAFGEVAAIDRGIDRLYTDIWIAGEYGGVDLLERSGEARAKLKRLREVLTGKT